MAGAQVNFWPIFQLSVSLPPAPMLFAPLQYALLALLSESGHALVQIPSS